ncbi:hypothetical protein [Streptomyces sp. NPDC048442]|uniref:bestrophin-like domain n=1 Tax=Streptomyces sp. NPDC048442 TaxID=3154823 RepID=UPI003446747D
MIETLAVVLGVAVLAGACVVVKHRFWPPSDEDEPREDVAEYISMMVGVLYALVLGLALVSVWDTRSSAEEHVQTEAGAAHQLYLLAEGMPAEQADRMRTGVTTYVRHVVTAEWPRMAERQPLGEQGWSLLGEVRAAEQVRDGATTAQQVTAQEMLAQISALDQARRGRESDAEQGLSPILWFGLVIGGVLTLAFMFMFGVQRSFMHVVMVMGLAALIAFMVLLIHQLDAPFSGLLAVDSAAYTRYLPGF